MTDQKKQTQHEEAVAIKAADLPAYCPTEEMGLWNSHPRVYIPLGEEKQANCPYCGTLFALVED